MTQRSDCTFTIRESANKTAEVVINAAEVFASASLRGGSVALEPRVNTSLATTQYLTELLNKHFAAITFTRL